jgi:hypothetical protein
VEGQRVDLFYRDLDAVRHWVEEAEAGRYEVDRVEGYLAGWPATCWSASSPSGRC